MHVIGEGRAFPLNNYAAYVNESPEMGFPDGNIMFRPNDDELYLSSMTREQSTVNTASTIIGTVPTKEKELGDLFVHPGVRMAEKIFPTEQARTLEHKFEVNIGK